MTQPLPMSNLNGSVDVTRADLSITSRPIAGLRVRGAVSYDESKNDSKQADFDSAVYTDVFPLTGSVTNPVYGFERFRVFGSADYDVYKDVSVGLGGEYKELKRTGTKQEVSKENFTDGWGRVEYRPSGLSRHRAARRRAGAQARRLQRRRGAAGRPEPADAQVQHGVPVADLRRTGRQSRRADPPGDLERQLVLRGDSYTKSQIGLRSGLTNRYALDLNWAINEKFSAYLNGGQEQINSQAGGQQHDSSAGTGRASSTTPSTWSGPASPRSSPTT